MVGRIKNIIKESGLSNGEFADRIGVNRASLSHILSGRNKPSLDFVIKLLGAFDYVSSDWLLFGRKADKDSDTKPVSESVLSVAQDEDTPEYGERLKKETPGQFTVSTDEVPERIVFFFPDGSFKQYS